MLCGSYIQRWTRFHLELDSWYDLCMSGSAQTNPAVKEWRNDCRVVAFGLWHLDETSLTAILRTWATMGCRTRNFLYVPFTDRGKVCHSTNGALHVESAPHRLRSSAQMSWLSGYSSDMSDLLPTCNPATWDPERSRKLTWSGGHKD